MSNFDNTNRGMLFKSKDRRSDKSPEYYGSLNVNGVEYKISAWVKTSKKTGEKFFSLSIQPKGQPGADRDYPIDKTPKTQTAFDEQDELPF